MKRALLPLFALALVAVLAQPGTSDPGRGSEVAGYIWANQASSAIGAAYTPSTFYSFNQVGRASANSVVRTAVGTYTVTFKGVGGGPLFGGATGYGPGGHVQVTAYGSEDADYCKVQGWASGGADFTVTVRCYNPAGALSDNRFDLLWIY
jgi:hypothetical protein